jgi:hypothetical protein
VEVNRYFTPLPFYPPQKQPPVLLDFMEKIKVSCLYGESNPYSSAVRPESKSLYWLSYQGYESMLYSLEGLENP